MLRITRLSDYAIVVLASAARSADAEFTARSASEQTHLPLPAVKKILKNLSKHGIVVSERGTTGGYRLGRAATQIALADIIDAVEGPFALTECGHAEAPDPENGGDKDKGVRAASRSRTVHEACEYSERCAVQANWSRVNGIVRRALASVTLADMIGPGDRELVRLRVKRPGHPGRVRDAKLRQPKAGDADTSSVGNFETNARELLSREHFESGQGTVP